MDVRLQKDREEVVRLTRSRHAGGAVRTYSWYRTAWRLVNPDTGNDVIQPWFRFKYEAEDYAREAGWTIIP